MNDDSLVSPITPDAMPEKKEKSLISRVGQRKHSANWLIRGGFSFLPKIGL